MTQVPQSNDPVNMTQEYTQENGQQGSFRCQRLAFTYNNPTEEDMALIKTRIEESLMDHLTGAVISKEHWTDGGTPHLQGFLRFKKEVTINQQWRQDNGFTKACLFRAIHSSEANWNYCKKSGPKHTPHKPEWGEEVWIEVGDAGTQGKRTDIDEVKDAIDTGMGLNEIARMFPNVFVKFHGGVTDLHQRSQKRRRLSTFPRVLVLYGATGTGKSYMAHHLCETMGREYYVKTPNTGKWWNGYDGQKSIIMEEFRGSIPFSTLLMLTDRYGLQLEPKHGMVQVKADTIIICSPVHPKRWYQNLGAEEGSLDQLKRRLLQENPESRVINTTIKKCVNWEEVPLPYQLLPDWLTDSATETLSWQSTNLPLQPLDALIEASEVIDLTQE
jgi:hypothetical protein